MKKFWFFVLCIACIIFIAYFPTLNRWEKLAEKESYKKDSLIISKSFAAKSISFDNQFGGINRYIVEDINCNVFKVAIYDDHKATKIPIEQR